MKKLADKIYDMLQIHKVFTMLTRIVSLYLCVLCERTSIRLDIQCGYRWTVRPLFKCLTRKYEKLK